MQRIGGLLDYWIAGSVVLMLLVSTLTREFQVGKNAVLEVADGRLFTTEKAFQVRFKLFRVRGGSGWKAGGYVGGGEKTTEIAPK